MCPVQARGTAKTNSKRIVVSWRIERLERVHVHVSFALDAAVLARDAGIFFLGKNARMTMSRGAKTRPKLGEALNTVLHAVLTCAVRLSGHAMRILAAVAGECSVK